jgi:diguanylate cyclase (GGDEF)-like protein
MSKAILFFVVAMIYILMAVHTLSKDTKDIKNRLYFGITILFAIWGLIYGMIYMVTDPINAAMIRKLSVLSWGVIYSLILHMIMLLASKEKYFKTKTIYFLLYLPALMNIILYIGSPITAGELSYTSNGWVIANPVARGFMWDNYFYFYYSIFVVLSITTAILWWKDTDKLREKKQSGIIVVTLILSFILGSIFEIILPLNGITIISGITIIIAFIPVGGIWYAIEKLGLMSFKPEELAVDVLHIMNEGLFIENDKNEIIMINAGALEILGYDENDKVKYAKDIVNNKYQTSGFLKAVEIELIKKNGSIISALLSSTPLYDSVGEKYGALSVFQDISRLKKAQDDLKKFNELLEGKVRKRTQDLYASNEQLKDEIKERRLAEQEIKKLAYYDPLTDLPNHRLFNERINKEIAIAESNGLKFALLFIDLDQFKRINDTMGHSKGNELLVMVAQRLKNVMTDKDFVSRNGGDEFLFIISDLGDREVLEELLNNILQLFRNPFILDNHEFLITCSIGVSIYSEHGKSADELMKHSDIAMYQAKNKGRNVAFIFDEEMKEGLLKELNLTEDLYKALKNNQFELHYQPQVDSRVDMIMGVEALIRWKHPILGFISPAVLIPLAEKTGLILEIGEWVIKTAIRQKKAWKEKNILDIPIAINLSVNQFVNNDIVSVVKNTLSDYGLLPHDIELEVTENIVMDKYKNSIEILDDLSKFGMKITIDDFGMEYSSLKYIKLLPLNKIKIDKTFIDGIGQNDSDEAIIKTIIALAHNLGLEVIAEGVEYDYQLEFLKNNSCYLIQGYYFFRPETAMRLEELFSRKSELVGSSPNGV